jgi:hypothetical protein
LLSASQGWPDHPDVATSLHHLSAVYQTQGQYAQTGPFYKRSLAAIPRKHFATNDLIPFAYKN